MNQENWPKRDLHEGWQQQHEQGKSFAAIARDSDVYPTTVKTAIEKAERRQSEERKEKGVDAQFFDKLSTRAKNCLIGEGLTTRSAVLRAFKSTGKDGLASIPNMGKKSLLEIGDALGGLKSPYTMTVAERKATIEILVAVKLLEKRGYKVVPPAQD